MTFGRGVVQRRPAADAVNRRAFGQKLFHKSAVALEGGKHQSGFAEFAGGVHLKTLGLKEHVHHFVGVHADGAHESRVAPGHNRVGAYALFKHIAHDVGAVAVDGARKVGPVLFGARHGDGTEFGRFRSRGRGGAARQKHGKKSGADKCSTFHFNLFQKIAGRCRSSPKPPLRA